MGVKRQTKGFLYVPETTTNPQPKQKLLNTNPDFSLQASHPGCIYGTMTSVGKHDNSFKNSLNAVGLAHIGISEHVNINKRTASHTTRYKSPLAPLFRLFQHNAK